VFYIIRYIKKLELAYFVGFYLFLTPVEVAIIIYYVFYYSLNQNVKPRNRIFGQLHELYVDDIQKIITNYVLYIYAVRVLNANITCLFCCV